MNTHPLVSIVIPVYNGSNYLSEAIESALSQTYPNIEIIVVNDGSNDGGQTRQVANSFGEKIRYFEKENGGVATALNLGILEMKGEYFSWLSHDDKYFSEKIEKQINFLLEKKRENIVLYSDIVYINRDSVVISSKCFPNFPPEKFRPALILYGIVHGCSLLIPKICFEDCGMFDTSLRTTQDYDLWFRLAEKYEFIHLPHKLVYSRIHNYQDTIRLNEIVLKERDSLHLKFINELSKNEIELFSDNNVAKYYIEYAKKMHTLRCLKARQRAIDKAYFYLFESKFITEVINLKELLVLNLKIKVRKILLK